MRLQILISQKKDYLTYTPYETFYSSDKAKEKAQKNGFIAENEGSASKFYNLILFDVEKEELKRLKTNFDVYYWPSTKTVSLQSKGCSRVRAIKELIDYLGFELDQVIYFGDGPNDLEVFKFVSCGSSYLFWRWSKRFRSIQICILLYRNGRLLSRIVRIFNLSN